MSGRRRTLSGGWAAGALALLAGCGGGGGGPTTPSSPPSTVPAGETVTATVFYDENGNGQMEGRELTRVPDVEVTVGGRVARSERGIGQAVVRGVAAGAQSVTVRAETLPPYYQAGPAIGVSVAAGAGASVLVPLRLTIGGNQPNIYMAFGDSLTRGEGSSDGNGYPPRLQSRLVGYFAQAEVRNRGADGTNSFEAIERLLRNLRGSAPAYTLILYGTNDWNDPICQDHPDCPTVDNLRSVVESVKSFESLPVVATLPPTNPALNPAQRNEWVAAVNERIKAMARQEGVPVADAWASMMRRSNWRDFFADHVHLNDQGYDAVAEAFFEAVSRSRAPSASASRSRSLFGLPLF
jgi:acyl-CoA thioesterase I